MSQSLSDFYSSKHAEGYNPTPLLWQRHPQYSGEKKVPYESH